MNLPSDISGAAESLGTLNGSFPYVSAWLYGGQGVLLASQEPQNIDPEAVAVAQEYLRRHTPNEQAARQTLQNILASELLDTNAVRHLVETHPPIINTDWNRWIEFSTPRYNASGVDWYELNRRYLASMALPVSSHR